MNPSPWNDISQVTGSRRREYGFLLALALVGIGLPLVLRGLALLQRHTRLGKPDVRGILADVGIGLLMVVATRWLSKRSSAAAAFVLGLWVLFNLINFVHVQTLNSSVSLLYATYVADGAFLRGSVMAGYWLVGAVVALVALAISTRWWPRYERWPAGERWAFVLTGAMSLIGSFGFSSDPAELPWRQENAAISNLQAAIRSTFSKRKPSRALSKIPLEVRADLSGTLRSLPQVRRPNVLIVLVESASGAYLPSLARRNQVETTAVMPKLDGLSSRALSFSTAMGHQRQTNRGEYSVLCGDLPKLRSETARMSEIALGQTRRRCLPAILSDLGYATAYLQAATMPFMLKDKFMKQIGFAAQQGAEGFPNAYASNAWGVDDHTFFEGALRYIEQSKSAGKPWFATLLTVGTHHPYLVAPKCRAPGTGFQHAFACADEALDEFVQQLRQRGILDDTLVIITADESAGFTEGQDFSVQLSQNWVPLVVLEPGRNAGALVDDPVSLSDIGVSILDYLGKPDAAPQFVGRSLFRRYAKPRTLYFANTYLHSAWALAPDSEDTFALTRCDETLETCQRFRTPRLRPFGSAVPMGAPPPTDLAALRRAVEYSTRRDAERTKLDSVRDLSLTDVTDVVLRPGDDGQLIFGGQYLNIEAGTELELELQFRIKEGSQNQLRPWFSLHGETAAVFVPNLPWMGVGDRLELHKRWRAPADLRRVEAVLSVHHIDTHPASLEISRANLRIVRNASGSAAPDEWVRLRHDDSAKVSRTFTGATGAFGHAGCLAPKSGGRFEGACNEGFLVFGPYAWAPKGATLRSSMRVRSKANRAVVWLEITNAEGTATVATTKRVTLLPGQAVELSTLAEAAADLNLIETRLRAEEQTTKATLEIEETRLEIAN
jgi:hypothetical protein